MAETTEKPTKTADELMAELEARMEERKALLATFKAGEDMIVAIDANGKVEKFFGLSHEGCWGKKRANSRRYYLSDNLLNTTFFPVVKIQKKPAMAAPEIGWAKIAASMRKYKINFFTAEAIEKGLRKEPCGDSWCAEHCKPGHTHWAQNYWNVYEHQPRIVSFADCFERFQRQGLKSIPELKAATEASIARGDKYPCAYVSIDGIKRDRSLTMEKRENGDFYYHAASEYAGCGNGSYYVMFSPTMAVYAEDD